MKLKPYKELIAMTDQKVSEAMAPIRAKRTKSKASHEMAKIEEAILDKEIKIQEMCIEKDIDFEKLLDELDEVALLERRKKQYAEVLSQLFPSKKKND